MFLFIVFIKYYCCSCIIIFHFSVISNQKLYELYFVIEHKSAEKKLIHRFTDQ